MCVFVSQSCITPTVSDVTHVSLSLDVCVFVCLSLDCPLQIPVAATKVDSDTQRSSCGQGSKFSASLLDKLLRDAHVLYTTPQYQ